jgi:hypothetical protein
MRILWATIASLVCLGSALAQPRTGAAEVDLPYAACGDMTTIRANLTGTPYPTLASNATLRSLGVRCIGSAPPRVRPRQ